MTKKTATTFALFLLTGLVYGQNADPSWQSNKSLPFDNFLAGVKYASIINLPNVIGDPHFAIKDRLESMGFEYVALRSSEKAKLANVKSLCDIANVTLTGEKTSSTYYNIRWTFYSCNGDKFEFLAPKSIYVGTYTDVKNKFYNLSIKMYGYKKPSYSAYYRLKLKREMTEWTEVKLKKHFIEQGADPIEGIYERSHKADYMPKYKIAIIKKGVGYNAIYIAGAINSDDWTEGEIKAKLTPTATSTMFKVKWNMWDKAVNEDPYITFEQGLMSVVWPDREKGLYIKLYPTAADDVSVANYRAASGTGFALTSTGFIVTNQHITQGAKDIKVRGIKGNFSKTYKAKVVTEDKNNDLAIIKIDDPDFTTLGTPPYIIDKSTEDVGNSIFVLGYPLRATMGDEIKLTNGIISSKSGFQGDITSYQISAPVQPGSSGGPVFDKNGNVIGIINAKHLGAENASYAVKASYLTNLIDIIDANLKLPTINSLAGKKLSDQVKYAKEFVYVIEVN